MVLFLVSLSDIWSHSHPTSTKFWAFGAPFPLSLYHSRNLLVLLSHSGLPPSTLPHTMIQPAFRPVQVCLQACLQALLQQPDSNMYSVLLKDLGKGHFLFPRQNTMKDSVQVVSMARSIEFESQFSNKDLQNKESSLPTSTFPSRHEVHHAILLQIILRLIPHVSFGQLGVSFQIMLHGKLVFP